MDTGEDHGSGSRRDGGNGRCDACIGRYNANGNFDLMTMLLPTAFTSDRYFKTLKSLIATSRVKTCHDAFIRYYYFPFDPASKLISPTVFPTREISIGDTMFTSALTRTTCSSAGFLAPPTDFNAYARIS